MFNRSVYKIVVECGKSRLFAPCSNNGTTMTLASFASKRMALPPPPPLYGMLTMGRRLVSSHPRVSVCASADGCWKWRGWYLVLRYRLNRKYVQYKDPSQFYWVYVQFRGGPANFFKVRKFQIRIFLGLFRYRKFENL